MLRSPEQTLKRLRTAFREAKKTLRGLTRPSADARLRRFVAEGKVPWADGYGVHRRRTIVDTLDDPAVMNRFRVGDSLPVDYGHGLDERCVEYPWVFSRLGDDSERVLDAGSALNFSFLLERPVWDHKNLHIVTLGPEPNCFWRRGVSYLYEDLRRLPLAGDLYDTVVSISTLEHVGMDNREFADGEHREDRPDDVLAAAAELGRVLKPGGTGLLTVPYGVAETFPGHQVFDAEGLKRLVEALGPSEVDITYFRYDAAGWQLADAEACADRRFVDWISRPPTFRAENPFPVQDDGAAAARAVACIDWRKMG